jgi:hypothetical protein
VSSVTSLIGSNESINVAPTENFPEAHSNRGKAAVAANRFRRVVSVRIR